MLRFHNSRALVEIRHAGGGDLHQRLRQPVHGAVESHLPLERQKVLQELAARRQQRRAAKLRSASSYSSSGADPTAVQLGLAGGLDPGTGATVPGSPANSALVDRATFPAASGRSGTPHSAPGTRVARPRVFLSGSFRRLQQSNCSSHSRGNSESTLMRARASSPRLVSWVEVALMAARPARQTPAVELVEARQVHRRIHAQGIAAHLVEGDQRVVPVRRGVLQTLRHHRTGELLPAHDEGQHVRLVLFGVVRRVQQQHAPQESERLGADVFGGRPLPRHPHGALDILAVRLRYDRSRGCRCGRRAGRRSPPPAPQSVPRAGTSRACRSSAARRPRSCPSARISPMNRSRITRLVGRVADLLERPFVAGAARVGCLERLKARAGG